MDYAQLGLQQVGHDISSPGYPPVGKTTQLFAEAYRGLEGLSQQFAVLEARLIGPRDAGGSGAPQGVPASYPAYAEDINRRVTELNQRLEALLHEI